MASFGPFRLSPVGGDVPGGGEATPRRDYLWFLYLEILRGGLGRKDGMCFRGAEAAGAWVWVARHGYGGGGGGGWGWMNWGLWLFACSSRGQFPDSRFRILARRSFQGHLRKSGTETPEWHGNQLLFRTKESVEASFQTGSWLKLHPQRREEAALLGSWPKHATQEQAQRLFAWDALLQLTLGT